jgi:membrane protease YdiL (CAAX protease family)
MQSLQSLRKQIVTFLVITLALSTVFYVLIISAGRLDVPFYTVGLMWCPGIAALITSLVYHIDRREFGWGWGKTRYQVLSYVLPVVYSSIAYGMVWLVGLGGIKEDYSVSMGGLVSFATVGVLFSCLSALGEEIGWRGFLVPRLAKITSFSKTSLISGAIWAIWHYPLILFAGYNNPGAPVWYGLLCFTIMVIGLSFACSWIRLKSGSLWTAMFLHSTHNQYIQSFFDQLTVDTGITEFITGEFGAALAIASLIVAFIFWRMRLALPEPRFEEGG